MAMKSITCREHGGIFKVQPRRGRPPVKCTEENPCTRVNNDPPLTKAQGEVVQAVGKLAKAVHTTEAERMERAQQDSAAIRNVDNGKRPAPLSAIKAAKAAKEHLEAQGWEVNGRANVEGSSLVAARGEELIVMAWDAAGTLVEQNYQLWNTDQPQKNNQPSGSLSFNPDECTDREIIHILSGMKVTWWNKLGAIEETAIITGDRITIEHIYNGIGDETPADRIIKFSDKMGRGGRAFRLGALLKVGG